MLSFKKYVQRHSYHLVDFSPWPLFTGIALLEIAQGAAQYFHGFSKGSLVLCLGMLSLILILLQWTRDINREAVYEGHHTGLVQKGLRLGFSLFIISELLFFSGLFWAFFHSALSPSIEIGSSWPPTGILVFNPWKIPFLNTLILLLSGCFVTWTHHAILQKQSQDAFVSLLVTVVLALIFIKLQSYEYQEANFCFGDGIYGSIFYLMTGCHALHVFVGFVFLILCLAKLYMYFFTSQHHFFLEASIWYWHMVDVVWLLLFILVYYWAGL